MRTVRPHSRLGVLAALLAAFLLALAPAAGADIGETIILRCTHGESLAGFSQSAYSKALKQLSADAEEYTDCASLIQQAQLAAASGRGGSTGSGAPAVALAASPSEQRSISRAAKVGAAPVSLGGGLVHPGVINANIASAFSSLPASLLAVLGLLFVGLLSVMGNAVRNRIRAGRSD